MPKLRSPRRIAESIPAALAGVLLPGSATADLQLRGFLVASLTSLLVMGLTFGAYLQGTLPWGAFVLVSLAIVAAVLGFYLVFRCGLNRAAADPSLTVHQMTVATLVMMYAMYSTEGGAGGVFPVVVLMIFLFGVVRLRTKGLLHFALFILAAHAATTALRAYFDPPLSDAGIRWLQWTTLAVTLPWFALMGGHVKGLREQVGKSNGLLRTALDAAQASERRLAEAQRIARLGSWTYDPATKIALWSRELFRIYGADPEQPVPPRSELFRRVYRDDRRHYLALTKRASGESRGFEGEYRILLPNGVLRWVHVVGEPADDDNGRPVLLRGTIADVTERKTHEHALARARDEAAAARTTLIDAIEALPEAFALFDAADRLVLCNGRYVNTFADGKRIDSLIGLTFADIVRISIANGEPIAPEFAGDVDAWVAHRTWQHQHPGTQPRELELGCGRWIQVTERATTFGGIVSARTDITERKQLEQRQAMEHAVVRLLAESDSVGEAMAKVIQTICETLGWDCGARWQLDARANTLHCMDTWSVPVREIAEFSAYSARQTYRSKSSGLVCRTMATGQPVWIADVSRDPEFKRASVAAAAGLRGAFAFPIRVRSRLVGAMEFFIRNVRQPDPALLRVLESIGLQLGQYIERTAARERLKQRAHYDDLTGLPNRSLFNELLARAFAKARRNGNRLAIYFIDLDGFKAVNDRLGHDAGDQLLATFSRRLQGCLRESDTIARDIELDTVARLGGDEFVVLVDDVVDVSALSSLAERMLVAAAKPFDLGSRQGRVSASIGIGIYPHDGRDPDSLIKAADSAMYEAKRRGTNGYCFHAAAARREVTLMS